MTTGDPDAAANIVDLPVGDAPPTWEAKGEDNVKVFTASKAVEVILASAKALRQRMVL